MRLELGRPVRCDGEAVGQLADIVVDPIKKRVTHVVVKPRHGSGDARLVPIELAQPAERGGGLVLTCTPAELHELPQVEDFAYLRLDELPANDPDWDVGVSDVLALPYYAGPGMDGYVGGYDDVGIVYDRVPKGEVEVRRASRVLASDGEYVGDVDGFLVDDADNITHFVLERGHLWGRREVTVPIGAVAKVESDVVLLSLTTDEIGALPAHRVRRWSLAERRSR